MHPHGQGPSFVVVFCVVIIVMVAWLIETVGWLETTLGKKYLFRLGLHSLVPLFPYLMSFLPIDPSPVHHWSILSRPLPLLSKEQEKQRNPLCTCPLSFLPFSMFYQNRSMVNFDQID